MNRKEFFEGAHKFASKVIDGTEKIVDGAGKQMDKAKAMVDTMKEPIKLEWEIAIAKNGLNSLFTEYGKICYYGTTNEGDNDTAEETRDSICEAEEKISQLEKQLADIKSKGNKRFCTQCGTESEEKNEQFCRKCGNELKD